MTKSKFERVETTLLCAGGPKVIAYRHPKWDLVVNACAHPLNLDDGTVLEPSGWILNAKSQSVEVSPGRFCTTFVADEDQARLLQEMSNEGTPFTVVTSIVALQAYSHIAGRSLVSPMLTPETARLKEKKCFADKWNVLK